MQEYIYTFPFAFGFWLWVVEHLLVSHQYRTEDAKMNEAVDNLWLQKYMHPSSKMNMLESKIVHNDSDHDARTTACDSMCYDFVVIDICDTGMVLSVFFWRMKWTKRNNATA